MRPGPDGVDGRTWSRDREYDLLPACPTVVSAHDSIVGHTTRHGHVVALSDQRGTVQGNHPVGVIGDREQGDARRDEGQRALAPPGRKGWLPLSGPGPGEPAVRARLYALDLDSEPMIRVHEIHRLGSVERLGPGGPAVVASVDALVGDENALGGAEEPRKRHMCRTRELLWPPGATSVAS